MKLARDIVNTNADEFLCFSVPAITISDDDDEIHLIHDGVNSRFKRFQRMLKVIPRNVGA